MTGRMQIVRRLASDGSGSVPLESLHRVDIHRLSALAARVYTPVPTAIPPEKVVPLKLVVTEKNIAAKKLAEILAVGKPKTDKVYNTPVYTFRRDGEDWMAIGLKGHILGVDFPLQLVCDDGSGRRCGRSDAATTPATLPETLPTPPWPKRKQAVHGRRHRPQDVEARLAAVPRLGADRQDARRARDHPRAQERSPRRPTRSSSRPTSTARASSSAATRAALVREVNKNGADPARALLGDHQGRDRARVRGARPRRRRAASRRPASRARTSTWCGARCSRAISPWPSTRASATSKRAGRVQTPTLALIVERELEREAFVPEIYWTVKAGFRTGRRAATEFARRARDRPLQERGRGGAASWTRSPARRAARSPPPRRSAARSSRPTPFNTTALQAAAAVRGHHARPARCASPSRSTWTASSAIRASTTPSTRRRSTSAASSRRSRRCPSYREHAAGMLSGGPLHADARREGDDRPPADPPHGAATPTSSSPRSGSSTTSWRAASWPRSRTPAIIEGTKVDDRRGRRAVRRQGRRAGRPGLPRDLPATASRRTSSSRRSPRATRSTSSAPSCAQKQTEPPARYSQGKLIQEMEKRGLGTKATRHAIIERLYEVALRRRTTRSSPPASAARSSTRSRRSRRASPRRT